MQQAKEHNEKSLICQFPQEAYERIFLECACIPSGSEVWGWITVSYVCRSWRIAALRSRKLWAFVDFSSPTSVKISLGRASGVPLSIRAVVGEHNIWQLKSVLTTAHQINDIHLHSSVHNLLPLLETLARPTLTHLVINVTTHTSSTLLYPRPDFPLSHQEVRLRTVELNAAPLYLIPYRCPSLIRLSLHNLPSNERRSDLYKLFSSVTQLQYLTICDCTITDEFLKTSVLLPCLHILTVVGSLRQVSDLLELVNLPSSCQLSCSLTQPDDISDNLWRFCQAISMHSYTSLQDVPLETLALTYTEVSSRFTAAYKSNPQFRQSIRICASGRTANLPSTVFDITIGPGSQLISDDTIITILTGIWRALLLTNVRVLSLHNIDIITQKTWAQFIPALLRLQVLDIRGYAPSGLVWALLLDALFSDMTPPRLLVPRLDGIYLYGVDCSSGGLMLVPEKETNLHGHLDDSSFLDVLVAALKYRQHQLRPRILTLTECRNVIEDRLKDIKQMGLNLVWDIRGKVKEMEVAYRDVHPNTPKDSLRHYNRLRALFA